MDRAIAREAIGVIATLIGEILEDHAAMALEIGGGVVLAPTVLEQVGGDVATLARAIEVIERHSVGDTMEGDAT